MKKKISSLGTKAEIFSGGVMDINEKNAPIALFAYKRPEHTRKVITSLIANPEFTSSPFYVFCDRQKDPHDLILVEATSEVVKSFNLSNLILVKRSKNYGLAKSIISGVTDLCNMYGKAIVVEDDLVVSPFFLKYLNQALNQYELCERVMQVSGHVFPVNLDTTVDAFFLPFTTSWGWATWSRAWEYFDPNIDHFFLKLKKDKLLRKKFDLDGVYPYFNLLSKKISGKKDSWAIIWYLNVFMNKGLTLYPSQSLVRNIGFDGSGENSPKVSSNFDNNFLNTHKDLKLNYVDFFDKDFLCFPEKLDVNQEYFYSIKKTIQTANKEWIFWKILKLIQKCKSKFI